MEIPLLSLHVGLATSTLVNPELPWKERQDYKTVKRNSGTLGDCGHLSVWNNGTYYLSTTIITHVSSLRGLGALQQQQYGSPPKKAQSEAPVPPQGLLLKVKEAAEAAGALSCRRVHLLRKALCIASQKAKLAHERACRHIHAVLAIGKLHNRPAPALAVWVSHAATITGSKLRHAGSQPAQASTVLAYVLGKQQMLEKDII